MDFLKPFLLYIALLAMQSQATSITIDETVSSSPDATHSNIIIDTPKSYTEPAITAAEITTQPSTSLSFIHRTTDYASMIPEPLNLALLGLLLLFLGRRINI